MDSIRTELEWWRKELEKQGKLIEAQRLLPAHHVRSRNDEGDRLLPRHRELFAPFSGRLPGEAPPTLLDYLPHDSLMFIDESHQTFRSCTACITATARAKRCWWRTVSACPARSTTGR
jgi:excinuclease ABC subunit B